MRALRIVVAAIAVSSICALNLGSRHVPYLTPASGFAYCEPAQLHGRGTRIEDPKQEDRRTKSPRMPELSHIESMTAEGYCHVLAPIVKDVPEFEVPEEYYDKILSHFRDSALDMYAREQDYELGTIRINYKAGGMSRLCWFWCGQKGRLSFSWNGIRYVVRGDRFSDDETLAFDTVIRRIAEKMTKAK